MATENAADLTLVADFESAKTFATADHSDVVVLDATDTSRYTLPSDNRDKKWLALDYFDTEYTLPDTIINLVDHHPLARQGSTVNRPHCRYLEGSQYAIIGDRLGRPAGAKKLISLTPEHILISYGGADPAGHTIEATASALRQWPSSVIHIVIGPLFADETTQKLTEYASDNRQINLHWNVSNLGPFYEQSDVVYCGGGTTLLEALCFGCYPVVIAQNQSEARHAEIYVRAGLASLVGAINTKWESNIEYRRRVSNQAQAMVDGQGAARITNEIMKL